MGLQKLDLPAEGILLYEFKHTDGEVVKEHHHQVHQILYALEGEGKLKLDGKDNAFNHDHIAVIVPQSEHSIVSDSKLTVLVLAFDDAIFDSAVRNGLLDSFFNRSKLLKLSGFSSSELRQLLRKMLFEQSSGNLLSRLAMRIILCEILLVLSRSEQAPSLSDANSLRAERIRHYIDTHYFEIFDANNIASMLGMSSRYVNMIFKEHFNITPMRYLTDMRIELAKKMLAETDKDIASICFELGFETVSTFYRIFKDSVEVPPNKYRTLHKIQERHMEDNDKHYEPDYLPTHAPDNDASSKPEPHRQAYPKSTD
jgi:AraC family transcriptional regulator, dual regulator of chb operon